MTELSKMEMLYKFPNMNTCVPLHFTKSESCILNIVLTFLNTASTCAKYYIPVYILQLALIGINKLDCDKAKKLFLGYIRSIIYGAAFPSIGVNATMCLFRALFGTVNRLTFLFVGLNVGATIFIESARNRRLNAYMLSAIAIEVFINDLEISNVIKRTPLRDTFKFMLINGAIMYFLSRKKLNSFNFWFYDVKPVTDNCYDNKCTHKDSCLKFLEEGFKKYFLIGYGWNLIKLLLKKSSAMIKDPITIPTYLIKNENFKFGAVLGLYAVIYRFVTCSLLKIDEKKSSHRRALHSLLAGTLAGCTYMIAPNLQFGVTAIVTLLQIFYEQLKANMLDEKSWAKVPAAELCFIVVVSYLNICYIANTKAFQRGNGKFIYDTFSANTSAQYRAMILQQMKLSQ